MNENGAQQQKGTAPFPRLPRAVVCGSLLFAGAQFFAVLYYPTSNSSEMLQICIGVALRATVQPARDPICPSYPIIAWDAADSRESEI